MALGDEDQTLWSLYALGAIILSVFLFWAVHRVCRATDHTPRQEEDQDQDQHEATVQAIIVTPGQSDIDDPSATQTARGRNEECVVCLERPPNTILPCGHRILCVECCTKIISTTKVCPSCRKPAKAFLKMHGNHSSYRRMDSAGSVSSTDQLDRSASIRFDSSRQPIVRRDSKLIPPDDLK